MNYYFGCALAFFSRSLFVLIHTDVIIRCYNKIVHRTHPIHSNFFSPSQILLLGFCFCSSFLVSSLHLWVFDLYIIFVAFRAMLLLVMRGQFNDERFRSIPYIIIKCYTYSTEREKKTFFDHHQRRTSIIVKEINISIESVKSVQFYDRHWGWNYSFCVVTVRNIRINPSFSLRSNWSVVM